MTATELDGDTIRVEPGDGQHAWFRGIAAGTEAMERVEEEAKNHSFATQVAVFWLNVGMRLTADLPEATEEQADAYISGANLRKPEPPHRPFVLDLDADAFDPADGEEFDEDGACEEMAYILRRLSTQIAQGFTKSEVLDTSGRRIGRFEFNPWGI